MASKDLLRPVAGIVHHDLHSRIVWWRGLAIALLCPFVTFAIAAIVVSLTESWVFILLLFGIATGLAILNRSIHCSVALRVFLSAGFVVYAMVLYYFLFVFFSMMLGPLVESFRDYSRTTTYQTFSELQDDLPVEIMDFPSLGPVTCHAFRSSFENIEHFEIRGKTNPGELFKLLFETPSEDRLRPEYEGNQEDVYWLESGADFIPFKISNAQPLIDIGQHATYEQIPGKAGSLQLSGRVEDSFRVEIEVDYSTWNYTIELARHLREGPL